MNEKVTLTVFKNSPHVWAGGLEGRELALWLIGRANALLNLEQHQQTMERHANHLEELKFAEKLVTTYATLGLSQQESDPIHPLSKEAIRFDMDLAVTPRIQGTNERSPAQSIPPVGFARLPDLAEAQEEFLKKRASLSLEGSSLSGQTADE
ncbi:hypothetical protein ABQ345_09405 [Serratia fonticola]